MTEATSQFLLDFVGSLFDNPTLDYVVLVFNDIKYPLHLPLIERCAPLLFAEFKSQPVPSPELIPSTSSTPTPDQIVALFTATLNKSNKKITLTISDPAISKEVVKSVLGTMYGKPLEINNDNFKEVYLLAKRFGMTHHASWCREVVEKTLKIETILEDYQTALTAESPFVDLLEYYLIDNLATIFSNPSFLKFTSALSYDRINSLIIAAKAKLCTEDLIYEMVTSWYENHLSEETNYQTLLLHIKLELLSAKLLTTKVKMNSNVNLAAYTRALEAIVTLTLPPPNTKLEPSLVKTWAKSNGLEWGKETCAHAAKIGRLDILQAARAIGCEWDSGVCIYAARNGHLNILQWAHSEGCLWGSSVCANAALNGHIDILMWAKSNGCNWDSDVCANAALNGHFDILKWARLRNCDWGWKTCASAAKNGHLNILQWARENGCIWDSDTCHWAVENGQLETYKWARLHGCECEVSTLALAKKKWPSEF